MKKNRIYAAAAAMLLVGGSVALAKGKGILFPDWSGPAAGTISAPAAEVGKLPSSDSPWTTTTMASSIEGRPVKGKPMSATGEIIDLSCYLQVGKHGSKHKDCGQKCVRNGQPVGLLLSDGTIYMLIDEEHDPRRDGLTNFRQFAVDNMANIVKVNGTSTEVEKQRAIYVQGFLKK